MDAERFPLYWPEGQPRTKYRSSAAFKVEFVQARDELLHSLELLGAKTIVISTNIPIRGDGLPRAAVARRAPACHSIGVAHSPCPDCEVPILSKALIPIGEPLCDRCGELAHFEVRIPLEAIDIFEALEPGEGWAPRRPIDYAGRKWNQLFCCLRCRDQLVDGAPQLSRSS